MKTLRTKSLTTRESLLGKILTFSFAAALILSAASATAQVTPLPVGSTGLSPLPFNALPGLADGWSYLNVTGGNGSPTNNAQMDTMVAALTAGGITQALTTDTTVTNATTSNPNMPAAPAGTCMRWNSAGNYICSRPTGIAFGVMMLTLVNNSGADRGTVVISNDFGNSLPSGASIDEDPRASNGSETPNQLGGFRVYYSLTGAANSWQHIPEFDGTNAGVRLATVTLASAWVQGQNLYIIWVDDNAVNGSGGNTGVIEGPWTLDNLALNFGVCVSPTIDTQPHPVSVEVCRDTNLTVVVTGSGPSYQWFKEPNTPVAGATSATLNFTKASASDAGNYFVRATACGNTVESTHVAVNVTPDGDAPTVVRALIHCDRHTVTVSYSELMDASSATIPDYYSTSALDGGTDFGGMSAVLTNGTNVIITLAGDVTAGKNYRLVIDPNVADCAGNLISDTGPLTVPVEYELCLLAADGQIFGQTWKYNHSGVSLGTDWRLDPSYVETDADQWSNGVSVFDAKSGATAGRTTIPGSGLPVRTMMLLNNANFPATDIPVYYFRTHFNFPTATTKVLSLGLRTFDDDFSIIWLNNQNTPAHVNPGYTNVDLDIYDYSGGAAVGDANFLGPYAISPALINYGDNLVCAKLHQANSGSSDITFALELTAIVSEFIVPVTLSIVDNGTTVHITWTDTTQNLYQANTVDAASGSWTQVVNGGGVTIANGTATIPHNQKARFYTLRQ